MSIEFIIPVVGAGIGFWAEKDFYSANLIPANGGGALLQETVGSAQKRLKKNLQGAIQLTRASWDQSDSVCRSYIRHDLYCSSAG